MLFYTKMNILVSPNPFKDYIVVNSDFTGEDNTIQIIDIKGKIVYDSNLTFGKNSTKIYLSNLQSGIYFVKINSGSIKKTLKFIKI